MKSLIVLSALVLSTQTFAQDKCYEASKKAAFNYAIKNESVTTLDEFGMLFGNEHLKIEEKDSWQKEFWAFGDGSSFIYVTAHSVKNKCFIKEVFMGQDDQDHE